MPILKLVHESVIKPEVMVFKRVLVYFEQFDGYLYKNCLTLYAPLIIFLIFMVQWFSKLIKCINLSFSNCTIGAWVQQLVDNKSIELEIYWLIQKKRTCYLLIPIDLEVQTRSFTPSNIESVNAMFVLSTK